MRNQTSPITGEAFPALNEDYEEYKRSKGLPGEPNLEFTGDMLDSLSYETTREGIKIGVFGKSAGKADGHNNLSGKSKLPQRQFLPDKGQTFVTTIEEEVDRIIADYVADEKEPDEEELSNIYSSSGLYDYLQSVFGFQDRGELRNSVLRNPKWYNELSLRGLIKWL